MTEHVDPSQMRVSKPVDRDETRTPDGAPEPVVVVPPRPAPRRLRRLLLGIAGVGVLGYGATVAGHYWTVGRFLESTDDAYVEADSTVIAPKVGGYLREVLVGDNQPVTAGQPLARIDNRDYAVAVTQAKADVEAARAEVDDVRASIDQQGTVIAQAQSTVTLDEADLTFARQEKERYATLANRGAGTVQNAQSAVSKLAIAAAKLQRDLGAVAAAEKQVHVLTAQVAKAEAQRMHDEAAESQAELNLSYTTIEAPVDGTVGARTLRVGQYVQAGTALMTVVPLTDVYVVANYKETQLTNVRAGQTVDVDVDMFPDRPIQGTVDSVAPASGQEFALLPPDNATGNFTKIVQRVPVRIKVKADGPLAGQLRPGMSVEPTIDTRGKEGR